MPVVDPSLDLARIHSEVDEKGFSLLPAYLDDGFCAPVRRFIDDFDTARSEVNYGGSEKRVWMAHEKDAAIAGFRGFADELLSRIYGKEIISRDTLAIRNLPVEQTLELIKGRWHLDSLRTQVKVFAFLTEVTERSGPLEVIPGTHRGGFKALHVIDGHLLKLSDFRGNTRKYQKLDDIWVDRIARASGGEKPFICPAGTVAIVDTSAIHRARPCLEANRYALTSYYDHF
ncbi:MULTISPECIES: phytanoyl-CoA dioxygenase family protein [unclassified Sphingomonas]|uniref:phytanoyl-CoA dioxygenase family protein n=1 Tax=Sphingomonas TaxID=13687 RepID=UPI001ACF6A0C|nr:MULTISPECIES: phytanoyl-CoA dioxygenase family protein [unclassified Sphingomonas]MBN8811824.1 phytanoyl-CoA dioxygenase family protein [Sphingomonas sp.]